MIDSILGSLRAYQQAYAYPPHQVFIGNLRPDVLRDIPRPWYRHLVPDPSRFGPFGEIMPEPEFLGLLKLCDEFNVVLLTSKFVERARQALSQHRLLRSNDLDRLGPGSSRESVEAATRDRDSAPLYSEGDLVGCVLRGHDDDESLTGPILLENLACKASGMMAVRHALALEGSPAAGDVDYLLGCGEEATGDRYQRGAGGMAKIIGDAAGCIGATGSDVKAYCCAPVHALAMAGATLQCAMYRHVIVVGGGALAKLGMKYQGHLKKGMPILEDVIAAIAIVLGPSDRRNPVLRLDAVGRHRIGSNSSPQAVAEDLVVRPLEGLGLGIRDIDKYATEMHDPDITETAGSGNVPRNNYRILASLAVRRGEMAATDLDRFELEHGMPGFSPTQGHIASAIPFMGHARDMILKGEIRSALFYAKGSLFLGKLTQLSDGFSILLTRDVRD